MCKVKTGRENLSEALILHTGTQLPGYFQYLHGMELDSRNQVWENGSSSTFPQDQIMFVLFWQQLSTTELCYGPIMLQTTDPATKGYSFLSASFCTACLQNCGTRKALKPPIPKDNHREDNFTARNGLQVVGEDNRHLWKEQGKVWGQANHFWHSCLPLPPCPTHPLQSTQVSSALWIPLLQSVVVSHFTLF